MRLLLTRRGRQHGVCTCRAKRRAAVITDAYIDIRSPRSCRVKSFVRLDEIITSALTLGFGLFFKCLNYCQASNITIISYLTYFVCFSKKKEICNTFFEIYFYTFTTLSYKNLFLLLKFNKLT